MTLIIDRLAEPDLLVRLDKIARNATNVGWQTTREHAIEAKAAIERLRAERDEWKEKWIALARASLIMGGVLEQTPRQIEVECTRCGAKATLGCCCSECGKPTDE